MDDTEWLDEFVVVRFTPVCTLLPDRLVLERETGDMFDDDDED